MFTKKTIERTTNSAKKETPTTMQKLGKGSSTKHVVESIKPLESSRGVMV